MKIGSSRISYDSNSALPGVFLPCKLPLSPTKMAAKKSRKRLIGLSKSRGKSECEDE